MMEFSVFLRYTVHNLWKRENRIHFQPPILFIGRRYTDTFTNGEKSYFPMETFTVQMGGTYRFRIINVGFATPFKITFEGVRTI